MKRAFIALFFLMAGPMTASAQTAEDAPVEEPAAGQFAITAQGSMPAATPAPPYEEPPEPYARWNRLAISIGFGVGTVALDDVHSQSGAILAPLIAVGAPFSEPAESSMQVNAEVSVRYYFPYYVLAQLGFDAVYNWASTEATVSGQPYEMVNHNLAMEIPLLVGGYYPVLDRMYVHGALGPSLLVFSRSWFDVNPNGELPDYEADGGVGFHLLAGADYFVGGNASFGLELRYRFLSGDNVRSTEPNVRYAGIPDPPPSATFDMSGFSAAISFRVFVL